jgi:hypothetical protein
MRLMTSDDRTLTRAVMQAPKLIRPPTDATPAEAAARGRPRALPDDFLREASGSPGHHVARRRRRRPVGRGNHPRAPRSAVDAVRRHSNGVGLTLGRCDRCRQRYGLARAVRLYTKGPSKPAANPGSRSGVYGPHRACAGADLPCWSDPPDTVRRSTDLVDWGRHPDVFGHRSKHTVEDASRWCVRGVHESSRDALGSRPRLLGFRPGEQRTADALPDYLLVGVAVVISRVVTTLGRQVAKAREMGSYQLSELLGVGAWARSTRPLIECWPGRPPSS